MCESAPDLVRNVGLDPVEGRDDEVDPFNRGYAPRECPRMLNQRRLSRPRIGFSGRDASCRQLCWRVKTHDQLLVGIDGRAYGT